MFQSHKFHVITGPSCLHFWVQCPHLNIQSTTDQLFRWSVTLGCSDPSLFSSLATLNFGLFLIQNHCITSECSKYSTQVVWTTKKYAPFVVCIEKMHLRVNKWVNFNFQNHFFRRRWRELNLGREDSLIFVKQINGTNLSSCRITQCLSKVTIRNIIEFPLHSQRAWSMYKHPQSWFSCATLNTTFILTKNKSVCVCGKQSLFRL